MNIGVMLILSFGCVSSIHGDMAGGHSAGTATAQSLLGGAQAAAQHTASSTVPGFVTDSPKEASLDNSSIGGATSAQVSSNEASTMIAEHSRTRQKFRIEHDDPMVINANRATANPEQTMEEMVVETSDGTGEQDELHECMEGGDEYLQTCRKQLIIKIQITPGKRWCECHLHWWYPTHGHIIIMSMVMQEVDGLGKGLYLAMSKYFPKSGRMGARILKN